MRPLYPDLNLMLPPWPPAPQPAQSKGSKPCSFTVTQPSSSAEWKLRCGVNWSGTGCVSRTGAGGSAQRDPRTCIAVRYISLPPYLIYKITFLFARLTLHLISSR
ncbi:hypothetical protein PBY51_006119 [Eleginops maclovinus]|uniref:Uncharacterized protein n=1 Tax=Eleginops maclovinus TaxID=56733 RepID=A0AAN7WTA2_ELEMC|nr:hypothetical protein PBY51_006119 [Eleginops maclovinus]